MELFSKRYGYREVHTPDPEFLSELQRTRLRNIVVRELGEHYEWYSFSKSGVVNESVIYNIMCDLADKVIYIDYDFNRQSKESNIGILAELIRDANWIDVYDALTLVLHYANGLFEIDQKINAALREENAGFIWYDGSFVPVITKDQADQIRDAKNISDTIAMHLNEAQAILSDKKCIDFRNSVKESVCAVESACQMVTGDKKATLGKALKKIDLHPSLKASYSKLYGYASDGDGIRHALSDSDEPVPRHVAKYMWISCSAFICLLFDHLAV